MRGSATFRQRRSSGAFVAFLALFLLAPTLSASCPVADESARPTSIAKVIDGDTLELAGGKRVRIIGINAPETHDTRGQGQPYASQSRDFLKKLIRSSDSLVLLEAGIEKHDRHGRQLAYLFDSNGRSITEQLIKQGLAARATVPPNSRYADCYQQAEDRARQNKSGLWQDAGFWLKDHEPLSAGSRGFYILIDNITRIDSLRHVMRITLQNGAILTLPHKDLSRIDSLDSTTTKEHIFEARGWGGWYQGAFRLRIRHPLNLRIID